MKLFEDIQPASTTGSRRDTAFVGGRWALVLALALIAALAGVNLVHWVRGNSAVTLEMVVQQPVPADNAPSENRADVTADDPGDNP